MTDISVQSSQQHVADRLSSVWLWAKGFLGQELPEQTCYQEKTKLLLDWVMAKAMVNEGVVHFDHAGASERAFNTLRGVVRLFVVARDKSGGTFADSSMIKKFAQVLEIVKRIDLISNNMSDLVRLQQNDNDPLVQGLGEATAIYSQWIKYFAVHDNDDDEDDKKRTDFEILLLHILRYTQANGLRKRDGRIYKEKVIFWGNQRYGSKFWEPYLLNMRMPESDTIAALMETTCDKDLFPQMWSKYVNLKGNLKHFINHLTQCKDSEFAHVIPQRNMISFKNGILDTTSGIAGVFMEYSDGEIGEVVACNYIDQAVDKTWFDVAESRIMGWWSIPTPQLQSILDYQNYGCNMKNPIPTDDDGKEVYNKSVLMEQETQRQLDDFVSVFDSIVAEFRHQGGDELAARMKRCMDETHVLASKLGDMVGELENPASKQEAKTILHNSLPIDAQKWIFIFMGRMLHELNKFDQWQVILFIKGKGGTGKSCLLQICKAFFAAEDVAVLSSNCERKFGLSAIYDKFMFLCMELKKSMALDPGELQSCVSGEDISVAIKNKVARTVKWNVPGMLAGNEFATAWADSQGSIARRIVVSTFRHSINENDSKPHLLPNILKNELAAILIKSNIAYRDAAARYAADDIWRVLPVYFKQERLSLLRDTEPLFTAIYDTSIFELAKNQPNSSELHDQWYCLLSEIEDAYRNAWRQLRGNSQPDLFVPEKYGNSFHGAGIVMKECHLPYRGSESKHDRYVFGIRSKTHSSLQMD